MDWANERYVKLFTRDTPEWLCWCWQARALWPLLIRKAERSGVIATKLGTKGLAALVGLPVDVVDAGVADLLVDGCLATHELGYVLPNYIEAQETPQSNKQRQKDSRERRRGPVGKATVSETTFMSHDVTRCHETSHDVTPRNAASQTVTPSLAKPSLADLSQTPPPSSHERAGARGCAGAIPPSTVYDPDSAADRAALAHRTYERMSAARQAVGVELGLPPQHPFPAITPAARPQGFRDLLERIREEGASAPTVCDTVVDNRTREARWAQSIEWLSERAFRADPWANMRQPRASFGNGHHPTKGASPTAIAQAELERLRGKERA